METNFQIKPTGGDPKSFQELTEKDGDTTAAAVDYADAFRTLIQYLENGMLDASGAAFLKAPAEVIEAGTGKKLIVPGRVFPNQPDPRYLKFLIPAISLLPLASSIDDTMAGKVKYKNLDEKKQKVTIKKISTTYVRQIQITGWWKDPIQRSEMTGKLLALFQVSENTGRITTLKGSHIYMTFQGDRDMDTEENIEDRIFQNVSTWKMAVRGFTQEEYTRVPAIQVNLAGS